MTTAYEEKISPEYTMSTVMEEAQRCLLCHDAPCSKACPAGTDPARFIRSVRFRNFKGAAEIVRENNSLGGVCAHVCPTERYCQAGCSRCGIDRPIDIGGIQRFVTDMERRLQMEILRPGAPNGRHVAVVGAGPAGLEAAASLRRLGYEITVFEKRERPGGYLRYGIPAYRLPDEVVDADVAAIERLGVRFRCGVTVGTDVTMESLKAEYDAVLVATGAGEGKTLPLFDGDSRVETAVAFLARVRGNKGRGESIPDHALVVGGGDVAMDAATTLKKLGVRRVTDVAYEEFCEFLASAQELEGARNAGVTIIDGYIPVAVEGKAVVFRHRHIDAELRLAADKIILAVGQKADAAGLGLAMNGNEAQSRDYRTADEKIFVAGDIAPGDKTVVWAVRKGREAARAIHSSLEERRSR